jgi:hypothetical protein
LEPLRNRPFAQQGLVGAQAELVHEVWMLGYQRALQLVALLALQVVLGWPSP